MTNFDNEACDAIACQGYFESLKENTRYRLSDTELKTWDISPCNIIHRF